MTVIKLKIEFSDGNMALYTLPDHPDVNFTWNNVEKTDIAYVSVFKVEVENTQ